MESCKSHKHEANENCTSQSELEQIFDPQELMSRTERIAKAKRLVTEFSINACNCGKLSYLFIYFI